MSDVKKPVSNYVIVKSMEEALLGAETAVKGFFEAFLRGPLYVPKRFQKQPLTGSPEYPNPFLDILGTESEEKVFVSVFSKPSLIREWCGHELLWRKLSGTELVHLMPPEWWICVNPGSDVNKELSPWEIERLKHGEKGIEEIAAEINFEGEVDVEYIGITEAEFVPLKEALIKAAADEPAVKRLFLLKETARDSQGRSRISLLAGVLAEAKDPDDMNRIQDTLQRAGDTAQIGQEPVKVLTGSSIESLNLGVFKDTGSFYDR